MNGGHRIGRGGLSRMGSWMGRGRGGFSIRLNCWSLRISLLRNKFKSRNYNLGSMIYTTAMKISNSKTTDSNHKIIDSKTSTKIDSFT